MGEFINHFSFLMFLLLLWAAAGYVLLRKQRTWQRWLAFGAVSVLLLLGYNAFRPAAASNADAAALQAQIGAGTPVLLEFQSQY